PSRHYVDSYTPFTFIQISTLCRIYKPSVQRGCPPSNGLLRCRARRRSSPPCPTDSEQHSDSYSATCDALEERPFLIRHPDRCL
ncbi:unnamed protein product, partial [Mycena citricolor]